ncbi:MAG: sensor histidine kinase [Heteroscytonema crispum UTEX LB 1556]
MNILTNAIDALEESFEFSVLSYELEEATQKPTIIIRSDRLNSDWATIRIIDNGPGIPENIRSRLFDPFFTNRFGGKATGLGLSISYQIIVEKHHGKLECHSTLGVGTEFIITIPIQPSHIKSS